MMLSVQMSLAIVLAIIIRSCTCAISTEDNTKGFIQSLYKEKCCNTSNSGMKFTVEQGDITRIVLCPFSLPKVCNETYSSCTEAFKENPTSTSGYFFIDVTEEGVQSSQLLFCSSENLCNSESSWLRVAHLNMSDNSSTCPPGFRLYETQGTRACGRPMTNQGSCVSVKFSSKVEYSQICGRVKGYQFGSTDAIDIFHGAVQFNDIDSYYADGISITKGQPRQHIWTLMAGLDEHASYINYGDPHCPCAAVNYSRMSIQTFVGSDYFCESGRTGVWELIPYFSDPLWDGKDCNGNEGPCCDVSGLPWFHKNVTLTTDYIELRVCLDQGTDNEDVLFEEYEIYVK